MKGRKAGMEQIEFIIRNEMPKDYRKVETITRDAFWNVYVPGCEEHYLVHRMRDHEDFIPELAFVLELEGKVIGNIMYTQSTLVGESGEIKKILTFGPLTIQPEYQRNGYGKALLEYSAKKALELGYDTIVIFGNPGNYVSSGFKSCRRYLVSLENEVYPTALLVKELKEGTLSGQKWKYQESSAYHTDSDQVQEFDLQFEPRIKEFRPSQEEFYILSHSIFSE